MMTATLEQGIHRASRGYVAPTLFFYDTIVYRIWGPYIWRCPTETILEHYQRHVRPVHMEAGCGTGYLPFHCGIPAGQDRDGETVPPQLTLTDLSPGSLRWSARRLSRYAPKIFRHDLYVPLPPVDRPFESVGLCNVLHCLPGNFAAKQIVIANLKTVMAADGVLFGSTVLGLGVWHSPLARLTLRFYNRTVGCFHNTEDTIDGLAGALSSQFAHVRWKIVGSLALFAASDRELPSARMPGPDQGSV